MIARASLCGAFLRSNPTDVQLAWDLAGPFQNVDLLLVRPCSKLSFDYREEAIGSATLGIRICWTRRFTIDLRK